MWTAAGSGATPDQGDLGAPAVPPGDVQALQRSAGRGLHLSPPDRALVLCVDEKSQIRALERTWPVPPGMPDCKRNGTTLLFAALESASVTGATGPGNSPTFSGRSAAV